LDGYKFQILEAECVQYFSNNKNSYETAKSLSKRLGRTEEHVKATLDYLVSTSFLEVRVTGTDKLFYLKKDGNGFPSEGIHRDKMEFQHIIHGFDVLTKREKEVALHVINGLDNQTIGEQLGISFHTVKNHITNIYEKLKVKDRVQFTKKIYEEIKK
jgi:DNA-binding CsgD family transcriptional regulator